MNNEVGVPTPVAPEPVVEQPKINPNEFDEVNVKVEPKETRNESYFDGKFIPYLAYSALSRTLKSTGIGNAWGETSWGYYKYNHTIYNGKRIKFEGKGIDLFPELFKWTLFSILTFGIYLLWIPVRKEQWMVSKLHFEDEEYVEGYSYFDGTVLGLIGVNIFCTFLTAITAGLLLPFTYCYKKRWYARHTVISRKRIIFDGKAINLFGNYIKWWLLSAITFGIYALWIPIKLVRWETKNTRIKLKGEYYPPTSKVPVIIGIILCVLMALLLFGGLGNIFRNGGGLSEVNTGFKSSKSVKNSIEENDYYNDYYNSYYNDYYDDYDY